MTKRNFEQARSRQRGRDATRDTGDAALQRLASGARTDPGKLRLVVCPGCGRERYIEIAPLEARRKARCTSCGTVIELD
jgi:hypothetical protein